MEDDAHEVYTVEVVDYFTLNSQLNPSPASSESKQECGTPIP